jgi:hypothetical protein
MPYMPMGSTSVRPHFPALSLADFTQSLAFFKSNVLRSMNYLASTVFDKTALSIFFHLVKTAVATPIHKKGPPFFFF